MSSKAYYAAYNASDVGKARIRRFAESPKRKIYQALYQDAHKEARARYDATYWRTRKSKIVKPKVLRPCATTLCTAMVWPAHGRKFCDVCRQDFGYLVKSRWWFRKGKKRAAQRRAA